MTDTIFARSSGSPPAAIAVIRISGPLASAALQALAGACPKPRRLSVRRLRNGTLELDRAVVIWMPGPATATGEDCAELHCHGGRAVISAIEAALAGLPGLRRAEPGEFTRRAFSNGRMDLAEAEGLADLLVAETELQRRGALGAASGRLSREVAQWTERLLVLAAQVEAVLDFSDEDDLGETLSLDWFGAAQSLRDELANALSRPSTERLRDGVRVILAGPPNAGKSSLFNALLEDSAAIVTAEAGTTRDILERPVAWDGVPLILVDTAGLRDHGAGDIEAIGIAKAREALASGEVVCWLGPGSEAPSGALCVLSKADKRDFKGASGIPVSSLTGLGLEELRAAILTRARALLPRVDEGSLNARQRSAVSEAYAAIGGAIDATDPLLIAEHLRTARLSFDRVTGKASTEAMLDALFARFCIGK